MNNKRMKYECGNNHAASEAFMKVALIRLKIKCCTINQSMQQEA
jgi:hypothetical protein